MGRRYGFIGSLGRPPVLATYAPPSLAAGGAFPFGGAATFGAPGQ